MPIQPPPPSDSAQVFSLLISPVHLIFPIVQLTGELRVVPHFGVSVVAGYGEIGMDENGHSLANKYSAFEIGTRAVWYPLKKFKSLQLGGELTYLKVDSEASSSSFADTASGVVLGPLVGYKLITSVGFTFLGQLGVGYVFAHNNADDSEHRFVPIANVEVGWSF